MTVMKQVLWKLPIGGMLLESDSLYRIDGDVSDASTKVYGDGSENFFFLFLGMSKASDKAMMKKQIRRIHSVFSHVGP